MVLAHFHKYRVGPLFTFSTGGITSVMMMTAKYHGGRDELRNVTERDILRASAIIRDGGVVAFPTETVYGLGADAFNAYAVARIFEIKARPHFDPLIVHIAHFEQVDELAETRDERLALLAEAFWPGPLTVVLRKRECVPDIVTAGLDTVAVRMPSHEVALGLIRKSGVAIAAPSANRFATVSPTTAGHVRESLGDRVGMILDGGGCSHGVESTIISLVNDKEIILLRPGAVAVEDIEEVIGRVGRPVNEEGCEDISAPGMLRNHYATNTPLIFIDDITKARGWDKVVSFIQRREKSYSGIGLMCLGNQRERVPIRDEDIAVEEILAGDDSAAGLREAGVNLFAAMRRLDNAGVGVIAAVGVPDVGVGLAINDRLRRAAHG